jgi:hypothetical protein
LNGALLLCAIPLAGQTPGFDVVSIRPSAAGASAGTSVELFEGGRICEYSRQNKGSAAE